MLHGFWAPLAREFAASRALHALPHKKYVKNFRSFPARLKVSFPGEKRTRGCSAQREGFKRGAWRVAGLVKVVVASLGSVGGSDGQDGAVGIESNCGWAVPAASRAGPAPRVALLR